MSEKELASAIDAALTHVDPDRRKFLGILLAGVAAAPLLTSADLAAQENTSAHKTEVFPKNATTVKGGTALKNNNESIKLTNANAHKNNNSTIKLNNANAIKGETKPPKSETTAIKGETKPPKSETTAIKGETKAIKGANTQLKNASKPPKSQSQPIQH
jgi:hypothetical protein